MRQLRSVLIIDDSSSDNLIHSRWLERSGAVASRDDVLTQPNGLEGLRFLEHWAAHPEQHRHAFPPELILLDINMPLMDGFEFLDTLQETFPDTTLRSVVLLMLSSSDAAQDRQRAAQYATVRGFITKPMTRPVIKTLLAEHFSAGS